MKRLFIDSLSKAVKRVLYLFVAICVLETGAALDASAQRGHRSGGARITADRSQPHWHYSAYPKHGAVITTIPRASARITYRGNDFFFHRGVYYHRINGRNVVVCPPIGLRVNVLPRGFLRFWVGPNPYFYYFGTYYVYRDSYYEVVKPPLGALVESIPDGYEKLEIEGQTFYIVDGVQYKPVLKDGVVWYQVVKVN
jgi:hypothetical protein